jgi:hypothetical protein
MPGFQIGEVFTESLRFLLKQLRPLFILAAVPYGVFLVLSLIASSLFPVEVGAFSFRAGEVYNMEGLVIVDPQTGERFDMEPLIYLQLLMLVLDRVVLLPFKVTWLRYVLLGPRFQPVRPAIQFGDRELRFLAYSVGLTLVMLAIGGLGGALAGAIGLAEGSVALWLALMLATAIALAWTTARLYFMLPPLAMDLPGGFRRAWAESAGQGFRLVVLTMLVLLTLGLPVVVISTILGGAPLLATVVVTILQIVVDGALWTALAFAYWRTTRIPGPQQGPAPTPGPTAT